MARMRIFNRLEEEAFESPPVFNSAERKRFFSLPLALEEPLLGLRTPTNRVCFLVVAGYFKARHKFFSRQFRQTDIEYVASQMGVNPAVVSIGTYGKETYARHQRLILAHFGYRPFDGTAKTAIANEMAALVRVQSRPKLVLLEGIQLLTREKVVLPSYNVLADLTVAAIDHHHARLLKTVNDHLSKTQRDQLDALLEKEPDNGGGEGWRYHLTLLKKANQSTQPSKIKANLADMDTLQAL